MAQGIAGAVLIALSCLAADRYAATLTGDPLALIVLIHTAIALDVDSVQRRRVWRPRTEERVAALEALMRQLGPYSLAIPLASAAQS